MNPCQARCWTGRSWAERDGCVGKGTPPSKPQTQARGNMATHRNHLSNGMASIRPGSKFGPADSQRFSGPVTGKAVWFSHGLRPPKDGRLRAVNVEGAAGGSEFHQMQIAGIQIIQPNVNILSGVRGFNTFVDIINHVPKTVTPPIPAVEQLEFGPIWIGLELVER